MGQALGSVIVAIGATGFAVIRGPAVKTYATIDGVMCQSYEQLD
ncbi:MAG: hypothetical protein WD904_06740 [Dehalococcoidia bacterium]